MVLAVFLSIRAAQKHASVAECQRSTAQTRGKVFTQAFSPEPALTPLRILPRTAGKLTGSAKVRLIARAIHNRSRRSKEPFISVNSAAIPRSLIAAELFRVRKGRLHRRQSTAYRSL
ncbi:MAG: sigma 54-interacting transcriptional regulator [Bryobacteraceae bacterium]